MTMATAPRRVLPVAASGEALAAYVTDPAAREVIARAARRRGIAEEAVVEGDITAATRHLAEAAAAGIILVELGPAAEAPGQVAALARMLPPETFVIGIGDINDVALYRRLMHAGLGDYLVKPVDEDALEGALERAVRRADGDTEAAGKGRIVTVIGARGGVGASTVALNCAWLMAHQHKLATALVDLDLHFGTTALALDLMPGRGLREALENPNRIDALFVSGAMLPAGGELYLLAGEEPLEDEAGIDPAALTPLMDELQQKFARVVIDVPRRMALRYREVLTRASEVIVVADRQLPAVRDTVRLLSLLDEFGVDARRLIVATETGRHDGLSAQEFEHGVKHAIDHAIPFDPKAAAAALNAGRPMVAQTGSAKAALALRQLAAMVTGQPVAARRRLALPWRRGRA